MKADGQLWYLMIDRKRVGPISEAEVREKYEQREIGPRTFAWTPGQGKWERLFNLPELFSTDTMRGTGKHKEPSFKETLPMPMLGDGEEGQPPAEPDDEDELGPVDPHAVTTQWDPDDVEAAIKEIEVKAKDPEPGPEPEPEPEVLKPGSPAPEEAEGEQGSGLDDDLAELFGRQTGPKPRQTSSRPAVEQEAPVREASTPDAVAEAPVLELSTPDATADEPEREVSTPDATADEPPVRELSTPDAAADEPPVRELSTPDAAADEPPVREVSTPDAAADEPPIREVSTPDAAADEPPIREVSMPVVVKTEAVDPLADTGRRPPVVDLAPGPTGPNPVVSKEEDEPQELQSRLLGARDEDSVLFSRDQLDDLVLSLGYGAKDDESENSLIDIKPLAEDSFGISASHDADDLAPLTVAAPAANIMFPAEESPKRRSLVSILFISFVGIILAFGLLVGVLYLVSPNLMHAILEGKLDQQITGKGPADETRPPGDVPPAGGRATTPPAGASGEQPRSPVKPGTRTTAAVSGEPKKVRKGLRRKRGKGKKPALTAVDPTVTRTPTRAAPLTKTALPRVAPVTPPVKAPAKKGGDELDRLIDGALEGKAPKGPVRKKAPVARKEAPPPQGNPISREVFNLAMSMAEDDVNACGKRFSKTGVVTIKITINGATGRIARGHAVGSTAGTPVGACVAKAAKKSSRFPKFGGGSRTMSYAYILR